MFRVTFRYRVIFAFLSVIIIPLIITLSFLFLYGKYLYSQDADSFMLSYDTTSAINHHVTTMWNAIFNEPELFQNGMSEIIGDLPISLRIIDINGELVYDSSGNLNKSFEFYTQIIPGLEGEAIDPTRDLLSYTLGEYIYIDDQIVGIKIYTYPPPPNFFGKLFKLLLSTFILGFTTLVIHIVISVYLISRRVTKPLKELDTAIKKISINDYDFQITYDAKDELGTLCQAFESMKDKLKDYHQKEEEVMETKKQLVAAISHDLRTPMTSIKGYVEALQDGIASDPDKFNEYLSIIKNKVDALNLLIDDLFNFSKLDLGQLKFERKRIHVKTFAQGFYMDIKEEAGWQDKIISKQFKNIDFAVIDVDSQRLEQALNNLVINALKYSNNEVIFKCFTFKNKAYFSIIDDGPGIPPGDIPKIFNRFYKVEKSRSTNTGTGLGLAIAKSIINQMGGEIEAQNNDNSSGAAFTISIPLVQ